MSVFPLGTGVWTPVLIGRVRNEDTDPCSHWEGWRNGGVGPCYHQEAWLVSPLYRRGGGVVWPLVPGCTRDGERFFPSLSDSSIQALNPQTNSVLGKIAEGVCSTTTTDSHAKLWPPFSLSFWNQTGVPGGSKCPPWV